MRVPGVVALLRESKLVDSLVHVPKLLRRRPTRCNFHDDDSTNTSTTDIAAMRQDSSDVHPPSSACFLCHNSFDLTDADALGLVLDDDDQHVSMGAAATRRGYAMTFHMVSDTLTSLRHRGVHLSSWEASLHRATSVATTGIPAASECRVCLVCYQIYKHQAAVCDTAAAIHSFFVPPPIMPTLLVDSAGRRTKHDSILQRIDAFRQERDPHDYSMPEEDEESAADHLRIVRGPDVDPNCQQFCFFLLFHELQDVLGRDDPTNYHLEYQLGQTFSTLSFDGPKVHTAHRWQLCEARAHYAVATPDALRTMCRDHKIQIKMKTTHTHAFEGHAVLSLKPLLGQASAAAASIDNGGDHDDDDDNDRLQGPSHCGVLVHVKTHSLGLLKLKVTLGVFGTHQHDFAALQGAIAGVDFVQEHQVFWPDVSYYQPSIAVPIEWMPLFAPPDLFGLNAEGVAAVAGYVQSFVGLALMLLQSDSMVALLDFLRSDGINTRRPSLAPTTAMTTESSLMHDLQRQRRDLELQAPFSTVHIYLYTSTPCSWLCAVSQMRRLVSRVGGHIDVIPTFLVATLLRTVSYGSWKSSKSPSVSSWRAPSSYALAPSWTLDQLFRGIVKDSRPLRLEAIALLAELLFVLLDTHCIPSMLPLSDSLEPLVSPYWLQQSPTKVLAWLTPQDAPSSCPSQHRILWNRAVRRCHLAGFTAHPDAAFLATHEWPSSVHMNAADVAAHKKCLRTRLRLLLLMHLFERIEAYDSGYMDMGEFRCLPQQLQQQADATNAADAKATTGGATGSHLIAWDSALRRQWTTAVTETTRDLVASAHFQDAFAGFDQFGSGGIGFRGIHLDQNNTKASYGGIEFWELAERGNVSPLMCCASAKSSPGLCLRHGVVAPILVRDAVCAQCDAEDYDDAAQLPQAMELGRSNSVMSDASFVSSSLGVSHRPDDEYEGRAGSFEDEDKLYPSSRQYSYFQSMEASSMTKDFQDKVQTRIRQRYRSVERVPDDLNPHTLAAILTRLEAAERDAKSTYPCVHASMPRLPTNHDHPPPHTTDDNDDAQREDHHKAAALRVLRRRERLRPLAPKKTVHPTQQQVAIDRLHAVPKSRRKRESYSALLQKELHLQLRPPDDLLDRIGRHQRKKKAVQFSCRLKCGL
ncbi:hypothetical protein DYB34_007180 [Aphanomyces astaci]|uniref:Uncharacterized protein n=1 Tax=Aphanomyces astaci TaxID=112090 RepID=A0A3R6ZPF2_APHAT|nr:hypothetical protein DYB34_007180 [Aphanomyces astaci]